MVKKITPFLLVIMVDTIVAGIIIPILGPAIMMTDSSLLPTATTLSMRFYLYSAVLSAFFIFNFFASPIIGAISDYYGRKQTFILCALVKSFGLILTALSFQYANIGLLIASRILVGAASATITISQAYIASLSTTENKANNLALGNMAGAIGFLFGPILSGIFTNTNIYSGFTYSTPFFLATILPLITIIFIVPLKEDILINSSSVSRNKLLNNIMSCITDKQNRIIFIVLFLTTISWSYFYLSIAPFLSITLTYDSVQNAKVILFGAGLFAITNIVLVPQATKYLRPKNAIKVACFFMIIGAIQLHFTDNEMILWLGVADTIVGCALSLPLVMSIISNRHSPSEQGKIMGISQSIQSLSMAVSAMTIGVISAVNITLPYTVIILFACCIFAIASTLYDENK